MSDAAASALAGLGVEPGDRVMLHLQNVPQFVIGLLAIWKLGAVAVPTNPMLRAEELRKLIDDCRPVALIGTDVDHEPVYRAAVAGSSVRAVITTSPLDLLGGEIAGAAGRARPAHRRRLPRPPHPDRRRERRPSARARPGPGRSGRPHLHLGDDRPVEGRAPQPPEPARHLVVVRVADRGGRRATRSSRSRRSSTSPG